MAPSVKVNFEGVGDFTVVPEGRYVAKVKSVEEKASKAGGEGYLEFVLTIADGEFRGAQVWHRCTLKPQGLWNLRNTLLAMGIDVPKKAMEINYTKLIGMKLGISVAHEDFEGKARAKVGDVFPVGGDAVVMQPSGKTPPAGDKDDL